MVGTEPQACGTDLMDNITYVGLGVQTLRRSSPISGATPTASPSPKPHQDPRRRSCRVHLEGLSRSRRGQDNAVDAGRVHSALPAPRLALRAEWRDLDERDRAKTNRRDTMILAKRDCQESCVRGRLHGWFCP